MPKSNTLLRSEFNYKFSMMSVYAAVKDIQFICTSYTRSADEQNKLFKKSVSKCDGYTNVSYHQRDRARDIVIIDDEGKPIWDEHPYYEILGKFFEDIGGRWGGNFSGFKDQYHYEY